MKLLLALSIVGVALSACSDPKAASKSNFKQAINAWVEKDPPCIDVPWGSTSLTRGSDDAFPRYMEAGPSKNAFLEESRKKRIAPFDALVEAGLLKASRTEITTHTFSFGNDEAKVPVIAYDLTDKGKDALKANERKSAFGGSSAALCYGKPQVDEVTQFTEPGEMMGVKMSQVSYRYHLADLPAWTKDAKVRAAFPQIARDTADSLDGKAALVLTNDGWKHERAVRM